MCAALAAQLNDGAPFGYPVRVWSRLVIHPLGKGTRLEAQRKYEPAAPTWSTITPSVTGVQQDFAMGWSA